MSKAKGTFFQAIALKANGYEFKPGDQVTAKGTGVYSGTQVVTEYFGEFVGVKNIKGKNCAVVRTPCVVPKYVNKVTKDVIGQQKFHLMAHKGNSWVELNQLYDRVEVEETKLITLRNNVMVPHVA